MSQDPAFRERFYNPETLLADVVKRSSQGMLRHRDENTPVFLRATVIAVDTAGGQLENESAQGSVTHLVDGKQVEVRAGVGPRNPRNSVKARVISDGFDQFMSDSRLRVFWPFFPEHVAIPVKPGEHVYVLFEDAEYEHGLWVSKVPGQENLNFFRGQAAFTGKTDKPLSKLYVDTSQASDGERRNLSTDQAAGESQVRDGKLSELF